jgi:hypothetical protein
MIGRVFMGGFPEAVEEAESYRKPGPPPPTV